MRKLRQAGIALVLTLLLITGADLPAMASLANASMGHAAATLPACCRRHGMHHCSMMAGQGMAAQGMAAQGNLRLQVSDSHHASLHSVCDCCPQETPQAVTTIAAWMPSTVRLAAQPAAPSAASQQASVHAQQGSRLLWRDRGPPIFIG